MDSTLHLLPAPLADLQFDAVCTPRVKAAAALVTLVIAENPRTARRILPGLGYAQPLQSLEVLQYDEHSKAKDIVEIIERIKSHRHSALLSEAGTPCVADPGSRIVRACHRHDIKVVPHGAASAILLALMASGLEGQRFTFHGYLPIPAEERRDALQDLERRSKRDQAAQLFIETPYRTLKMLQAAIDVLHNETELCIAQNLTDPERELIRTMSVSSWKKHTSDVRDVPAVFILQS